MTLALVDLATAVWLSCGFLLVIAILAALIWSELRRPDTEQEKRVAEAQSPGLRSQIRVIGGHRGPDSDPHIEQPLGERRIGL